ncbi:MAG: dihydrofolate reductase [Oscillospiraceae bacterium]|nr:dihydrofolate reductase [Oscillospiraceae bacterium]
MQILVNVARNGGIGFRGDQLFYIPSDLHRFRRLTLGKTIVMGRRTLEALPGKKPLPGRTNLILSSTLSHVPGAEVFQTLSGLFQRLQPCDPEDIFIIGGGSVYDALLPYCRRAKITRTYAAPEADTFFPSLDTIPGWELEAVGPMQEENGIRFQYMDYVNHSPLTIPGQQD